MEHAQTDNYPTEFLRQLALSLIAQDERCLIRGADGGAIRKADGRPLRLTIEDALDKAAAGFSPMAVPAEDVLAIDFDDPDAENSVWRFDFLCKELRTAGYTPLITASGRPGHKHLWCLIENPTERSRIFTLARALGLSCRSDQPMRLPLVPHHAGYSVRLLSPTTAERALAAVRRTGDPPAARRPKLAATRRSLSERARTYLSNGHRAAGFPSRSEGDWHVCLSAAANGWSYEELTNEYRRPEHTAGALKVLERGDGYLRGQWDRAVATVARSPTVHSPEEVIETLTAWKQEAKARAWPGRGGAVDRALYLAMIDEAITGPFPTFTPAISRHALRVATGGKGSKTIERSLGRLIAGRLVREDSRGDRSRRTKWRLLPPTSNAPKVSSYIDSSGRSLTAHLSEFPVTHDLFVDPRLGEIGWQVLNHLAAAPELTPRELATATGRHVNTVRRRLAVLRELGLAEPVSRVDGWRLTPDADLDAAAERAGLTGAAEERLAVLRQRSEHWRERQKQRDQAVLNVQAQRAFRSPTSGGQENDHWEPSIRRPLMEVV